MNTRAIYEIASRLIHPTGLTSTILFISILGRDIVTMLVKGDLAIVFPHINFELSCRPTPLPSVVRVTESEIALRGIEHESAAGHELDIEKAEEQSTEVGEVGDGFSMPGGGSANRTH